jgi:enoyl-CoA hydratase
LITISGEFQQFGALTPQTTRTDAGTLLETARPGRLHSMRQFEPNHLYLGNAVGERAVSEYQYIVYEVEKGRARITLNRPEKRNALSPELLAELHHALWEADDDKAVHGVLLKGAGKSFCAGYDLTPRPPASSHDGKERRGGGIYDQPTIDDDMWRLEKSQRLRMVLFDMHKPVVAQVHGHCLAGGTDIAMLCDMIIAADDATIGFPPARDLGALPNNMWLYNVGPQWAKRLTLTGDTVTGAEAAQIGLVLKSVPADYLAAECEGLMDRLAKVDPDLLSANKRIINIGLELMGARTLQRMAAENDARAHLAPGTLKFRAAVKEKGLKTAMTERDSGFGDGRARVNGPEIRDDQGRLTDD